ncbi:uncharacterized protein prage [Linepithema humile]|uniref:uncharacterized protein prage n=1 Tax=Linepithema humile TaxID=83485 RepID=UPI00062381C4|nr:PREDICTED: putative exonuclease GOR [Linepithema humile]
MEDRIDLKSLVFMLATTLFVVAFINILTHVKQRSQSPQKKNSSKDSNVLSEGTSSSMKLSQLTAIENCLKNSNGKITELWINTTIDEDTGFVINRCCTTGKYIANNAQAWVVECAYGHHHRIPVISKKNIAMQQASSTTVQQPRRIITIQQPILKLFNQKLIYKSCLPQDLDVDDSQPKIQRKSRHILRHKSRKELQKSNVSRQSTTSLSNYFENQESLKEKEIVDALTPYVLTSEQLFKYGYPIQSNPPSCAIINYTPYPTTQQPSESHVSNSTDYSQQKMCARCNTYFNYTYKYPCIYHWGKLWDDMTNSITNKYWTCCHKTELVKGCTTADMHVWIGLQPGFNGPLVGFVYTKPKENTQNTLRVAAVDCEMCFTEAGLEVVKVSVVDKSGKVVYEKLIKPLNDIIDYNTKFSGITKKDLEGVTDNLRIVQRELLDFISAETILIGHGLESDLRVLRLLHKKVIDTSTVYPHYNGFPYRNSLKILAKRVLKRNIQETTHNPAEDARAAMDLMMAKISLDKVEPSTSRTA